MQSVTGKGQRRPISAAMSKPRQSSIAPAGAPTAIVEKLHDEFGRALADPDLRAQLARMGVSPYDSEPVAELPAFLEREITRWSAVVKQVGIEGTQ